MKQLAEDVRNWKPSDVDKFNSMSWLNLLGVIAGVQELSYYRDQRDDAIELLKLALRDASAKRRGIVAQLRERLGAKAPDPVAFYKGRISGLPAEYSNYDTRYDDSRLERHEILAALALEQLRKKHDWKPTEAEILAHMKSLGIAPGSP